MEELVATHTRSGGPRGGRAKRYRAHRLVIRIHRRDCRTLTPGRVYYTPPDGGLAFVRVCKICKPTWPAI